MTYTLRETAKGWECWCDAIDKCCTVAPTPNEAVEKMRAVVADRDEFLAHNFGTCGDDCTRCKKRRTERPVEGCRDRVITLT